MGKKTLKLGGSFFGGVSIFSSQGELREIDVEGKEKGKVRFLVRGKEVPPLAMAAFHSLALHIGPKFSHVVLLWGKFYGSRTAQHFPSN